MIYRGYEQEGVYESEFVSLVAVRLKIIDLHAGDQPMISDDGKTVLVFNGEIYNHRELRAELESRGEKFKTSSATEVVLRAFLRWDKDSFARLRGMFALPICAQHHRPLVPAR